MIRPGICPVSLAEHTPEEAKAMGSNQLVTIEEAVLEGWSARTAGTIHPPLCTRSLRQRATGPASVSQPAAGAATTKECPTEEGQTRH